MNLQHADAQQINFSDRGQHPARIDVTDQHAVDYWSRQWGVSEFDLRRAVAAAGVEAAEVRSHLGLR